jgi:hypothetical protein
MTDSPQQAAGGTPGDRLASRLKEWQMAAGMPSTRKIADGIGTVSHTTIADALAGRRVPSWPVLSDIVIYLHGDRDEARALWAASRTTETSEVATLSAAVRAIGSLDLPAQRRVMAYLGDRFGGDAPEGEG